MSEPVAWLCRWTDNGATYELVVWATTIEAARQQTRDHEAGPHAAVAARLATQAEQGSPAA